MQDDGVTRAPHGIL